MSPAELHAPDAPMLRRVRWRLTFISGGATLATLVPLGAALYLSVAASLAASGERQLREQAGAALAFAERAQHGRDDPGGDGPDDRGDFRPGRPRFGGPGSGTLAVIVRPNGSLLSEDREATTALPIEDALEAARSTGRADVRVAVHNGTPVRVLTQPVELGGATWAIQILQDRTAEVRTLRVLLSVLVLGGAVVLATSVLLGFAYAGRALVPIRESLRRQREFAADASHELRTPLTVIRSSVEHLRRNAARPVADVRGPLDDIEAETEQLTSLVDDLLLLARADSGAVELRRERVDASEAVGLALRSLREPAERLGVRLQLAAEPAVVNGDPERLRQLVTILVDNAIKHSPEGATVDVRVARHGDRVRLEVDDRGSGIRPENLERVFDRFWRAPDTTREGTGLGLAIARWIAERHGGSVSAANRPTGGARFEVILPAA